ncbi:hypothetical protein PMAYCL1PPCAC_23164, partial [Pristionchus mayeri]
LAVTFGYGTNCGDLNVSEKVELVVLMRKVLSITTMKPRDLSSLLNNVFQTEIFTHKLSTFALIENMINTRLFHSLLTHYH